jgi:hypothetical protein
VLAPAEPFLLRCRDDPAVDDERRRRIVKDRVDAENSHQFTSRTGVTTAPRCTHDGPPYTRSSASFGVTR